MGTVNCRYIQGARFFGNSNVEVNSVVPLDSDQPTAEAVLVNDMTNSTTIETNFRARFVGQGYKQVNSIFDASSTIVLAIAKKSVVMLDKQFIHIV